MNEAYDAHSEKEKGAKRTKSKAPATKGTRKKPEDEDSEKEKGEKGAKRNTRPKAPAKRGTKKKPEDVAAMESSEDLGDEDEDSGADKPSSCKSTKGKVRQPLCGNY